MYRAVVAAIVLAGCAADRTPSRVTFSPPVITTTVPTTPVTLRDVILHPEWVGHAVTVDVFERMFVDTRTPFVVSAFVADVAATHFLFVEGPDDNANLGFEMMLTHSHALRVHGIVATSEGGGFQIAVDHAEVAPFPPAHKLASVHDLIREPAKWADVLVEVDATLQHKPEMEVLDREVWLEPILSLPEVHCAPAEGSKDNAATTFRLHIIGFAHTRGHYGHGNGWAAEIIGRRTFSAAENAASYLDRHLHPLFVGEPTGGKPNSVGDEVPFTLPYSSTIVNVSDLFWQSGWPQDRRIWIAPDLYAPPTIAALRSGRDPALEAILSYAP